MGARRPPHGFARHHVLRPRDQPGHDDDPAKFPPPREPSRPAEWRSASLYVTRRSAPTSPARARLLLTGAIWPRARDPRRPWRLPVRASEASPTGIDSVATLLEEGRRASSSRSRCPRRGSPRPRGPRSRGRAGPRMMRAPRPAGSPQAPAHGIDVKTRPPSWRSRSAWAAVAKVRQRSAPRGSNSGRWAESNATSSSCGPRERSRRAPPRTPSSSSRSSPRT